MASDHFLPLLIIFNFLFSSSFSTPTTPNDICNATVNPSFCRFILPNNVPWDIYDYAHFSFHQSLAVTKNLSSLISEYFEDQSNLPDFTIQPLQDCHELVELNIDFLSSSIETLNSQKSPLDSVQAQDMHAIFSAILTNQQTCIDGLQMISSAWNATTNLHTPSFDANEMYSLSLALFTRAWSQDIGNQGAETEERKQTFIKNGIQAYLKSVAVSDLVVVDPDGSGNYTTISDAINAAPTNTNVNNGYFVIHVVAGIYKEYVNISKNKVNLLMIGDGINKTVITGSRSVGGGRSTFNSATFIVVGKGFVGLNMTIRNTAGPKQHQAVALRNGADMSTFYLCSFEGYQDTLYTHSLRQFYRECDIYGTVDFIFGDAAVVLQSCNIYPTLPTHGQTNEVTAQGRMDPNQSTGTSIHNCSIRASAALASSDGTTKTYLGRPWKEYSRTVYMQSFMDRLIAPPGWDTWTGDFALSTLYYAEYNNTGPGSDTKGRVTWPGYHVIDATNAVAFTVSKFITGSAWLPQTGVPYTGGLI